MICHILEELTCQSETVTMDIDLPSDDDPSGDDSVYGGRVDLYEAYWLYVDGVRYVGPVLEQSPATAEDTETSPLARHYNHFYEKKENHKERCADLPGSLPEYKDRFREPRGDVRKVPRGKLDELGIEWKETDDPIWLPTEYELPEVWEDDLGTLDRAALQERIRKLRAENEKLRDERDELESRLAEVASSVSSLLDSEQGSEAQDTGGNSGPAHVCENCGKSFSSEAAKHGHSSHCDGSSSAVEDLEDLAKKLPELNDEQATEGDSTVPREKELENLNHLLNGSL